MRALVNTPRRDDARSFVGRSPLADAGRRYYFPNENNERALRKR